MSDSGLGDAAQSERTPTNAPDFQALFEGAPGLYLVLAPDLTIVGASQAYLTATMIRRQDVLGRGIFEVFPDNPEDPEISGVRNLNASLHRVLAERVPDAMAVQKYDIRKPDSEGGGFEVRYWSPINSPVFAVDGSVRYIIHQVEDVTEFVRIKQQGAEQERETRELRTRGEQMEAEIFQRAQQIQEVNERLRNVNADLEQRVQQRTAELAETNEALRAEMIQTERLADQIRQRQKMEAVGTLAGGIAHDFNNLLTVIAGYSRTLLRTLPQNDPAHDIVGEIAKAGDRASDLTRQLLAFSRQQVLEPKVIDINHTVADIDRMLRRLVGEDISLNTILEPQLGHVRVDPGQVEQVIVNLVVNARDAMPRGGNVTIKTSNVSIDASVPGAPLDAEPGQYVLLSITDNGTGMDAATRARIFEPFFTTKDRGNGTGLGLATVFGIVKQSRGHIAVTSEPENGTTFSVYLPVVDADLSAPAASGEHDAQPGSETVLLVEDDDAVRKVTALSLRSFGYTVLQASHGREAIEICETHTGPIDLLITDVIMPEMGGRQVADAVQAIRNDIRVLFLSGYTDDAVVRQGIMHERVAFLQKPFTPDSLGNKVLEVLQR